MKFLLSTIVILSLYGCAAPPKPSGPVVLADLIKALPTSGGLSEKIEQWKESRAGIQDTEELEATKSGSSSKHEVPKTVSPVTKKPMEQQAPTTVEIDPELLRTCIPLPMLFSKNATPVQILEHKAKETLVFADCSKRHTALAKVVRRAFNIPDSSVP